MSSRLGIAARALTALTSMMGVRPLALWYRVDLELLNILVAHFGCASNAYTRNRHNPSWSMRDLLVTC